MSKQKKRAKTLPALALRIFTALLAIWLLCMVLLTAVTAYHERLNYMDELGKYNEQMYRYGDTILELWDAPGHNTERSMIMAANLQRSMPSYYFRGFNLLRQGGQNIQSAAIFYDVNGEEIIRAGNYLTFGYSYEHRWDSGYDALSFVNIDKIPGLEEILREKVFSGDYYMHMLPLRLTGKFDGEEFLPVKIEFDTNRGGPPGGISKRDWLTIYEVEPQAGESYVTIYAGDSWFSWCVDNRPVRWGAAKYNSVTEAIYERVEFFKSNEERTIVEIFTSSNFNSVSYGFDKVMNMIARPVFLEDDDDNDETPTPIAFYMVYAGVGYPLKSAVYELTYVYIFTFVVTMIIALLMLRSTKRSLADPLKLVCNGIADGWGYVSVYKGEPKVWREPHEIARHYRDVQDKLQEDKNEITRLTAALEYAKEAEEQRQQLSSNIAHELKTPLAVIHSYAEGLMEHIAEEKRDKYLEVIVSETERMDEMVLEMLELSRLEAGRVKLARDVCDLSALVRGVFEKLEPAAAAKDLTISYELRESCLMSADEARILQVIENFASNALRYTPAGGHIWVRTSYERGYATFAAENTSPPLSDEVLANVWERFYRAEESRSEKSSGLGLAIAKSIVELHSGSCNARNTENGVEFSFTI